MQTQRWRRREGGPQACSSPCTSEVHRRCRCPDLCSAVSKLAEHIDRTVRTSERVDRDEHRADVCIDLRILPTLLQVLVNALVCDRGQQRHVRHSDLLLLKALLPICLKSSQHKYKGCQTHRHTLATLPAAPPFFGVAAAPFLPAFFDGAWTSCVKE